MNTISAYRTYHPQFGNAQNSQKSSDKSDYIYKRPDFKKGVLAGYVLASAVGIGVNALQFKDTKSLIKDFKEEYKQEDTQGLLIEDVNDDDCPELIIDKGYGSQYIYDIKNKTIHWKIDDESTEIIYD